jgi:hypothetical protein
VDIVLHNSCFLQIRYIVHSTLLLLDRLLCCFPSTNVSNRMTPSMSYYENKLVLGRQNITSHFKPFRMQNPHSGFVSEHFFLAVLSVSPSLLRTTLLAGFAPPVTLWPPRDPLWTILGHTTDPQFNRRELRNAFAIVKRGLRIRFYGRSSAGGLMCGGSEFCFVM